MTSRQSEEPQDTTKSQVSPDEEGENPSAKDLAAKSPANDKDTSDESSSDEEDDDLILEGVIIRNLEVESSDDDDDDDDDVKPAAKKQKTESGADKRKPNNNREPDNMIQVEFTFNDMDEKFFHGIKTLLHSSSTMYAPDSSALSDLVIENVSVGTVVSTEDDEEANVYGFASVLNLKTYASHSCIERLKRVCLDACPQERKSEMETVLSGKTKRPAGFLLQARMINLPLEVVQVLHEQLVLDMDWAVENAEGGEDERKSLDFGAFIRLAPVTSSSGGGVDFKYFDDEVFSTNAEFVYNVNAPKQLGSDEKQMCQVIVMTKTGHRQAMKDLAKLVGGT